ncbi:Leucine-rich repeat receptor-like serine threonine tyrosine-protein kinase [Salvia divinorum]|uniref:Leucine-rich repeat receptor-like serine threonine tyrosine-protein kinase n=1 Tax=Salvia divinorum TaxID=28513 RepID=A0ABD1FSB4_SALDI
MALPRHESSVFLLCFFTLTIIAQSKLSLLPSDHEALLHIHNDFGINPTPAVDLCDSGRVLCERRIIDDSYVLRVVGIVIESQQLDGKISTAIGQLSELKELSLPNNQISNQIPPQIIHCHKLEVLILGNNLLSGNVPAGFSSLIRLRILDLSSNKFAGDLQFLKHFPNLEKLNLANNKFAGKVPISMRGFRNLRFINVSGNSLLEGPIASTNVQLDQYLSVDLAEEERRPKRYVFAERSQSNLAMAPSSSSMANAQAPSPSATTANNKRKNNKKKKVTDWVLGFMAGILAGCVSGLVFSTVFKLLMRLIRAHKKDTSLKIFSAMIKKPEDLAFLEKEDGLQSLEVIGRGGCGEVYKAALPGSDGKEIAVKKIIQLPTDAEGGVNEEDSKLLNKKMRQIRSEIQTMGQIRHRNLLSLLAYLPRPNCHYLVFGVLLGGLVIGKMPSDEFFQHTDEMGLVTWMRNVIASEDPKRAIDPNLLGNGFEEQMLLVLKVACFCTLDNPKERPDSKDARCMLSQIKSD